MTDLGYGMQGMASQVLDVVDGVTDRFPVVTYVEIGVGEGVTLANVSSRLKGKSQSWRSIGIDLPDGYSFFRDSTEQNARGKHLQIEFVGEFESIFNPRWEIITVAMLDSHKFLSDFFLNQWVQLALIDGCHGKKCATMDFLLLEPMIPSGGVVMFHDFGVEQIGQEQPHCPDGLNVNGACKDLGLLDNSRPGWKALPTIIGDKSRGSADMGVFQKL